MGISRSYSYSLTGRGEAEQVAAEFISSDYLAVLDVKPVIGRLFAEGEDEIGASPIAMIGEGFWNRKLAPLQTSWDRDSLWTAKPSPSLV